jgi:hypothetical protein
LIERAQRYTEGKGKEMMHNAQAQGGQAGLGWAGRKTFFSVGFVSVENTSPSGKGKQL